VAVARQRHRSRALFLRPPSLFTLPLPSPSCFPSLPAGRYFETEDWNGIPGQWWFGGGTDITPNYVIEDDMKHFHGTYKVRRLPGWLVGWLAGCLGHNQQAGQLGWQPQDGPPANRAPAPC
jgi:hypothetical protein